MNLHEYLTDHISFHHLIIQKKNTNTLIGSNSASLDGFVEITIQQWVTKQKNTDLFLVEFNTTLNNHKEGTHEWHDMAWAATWDVITNLT